MLYHSFQKVLFHTPKTYTEVLNDVVSIKQEKVRPEKESETERDTETVHQ